MTKSNDGGPAFPGFQHYIHEPTQRIMTGEPHGGMSLRDYLAGQAIAGRADGGNAQAISEMAYELADAMLVERSKIQEGKCN